MSTDHQKYSTENQADFIAFYAAQRGYDIVRTYTDEGKSGLRIDGREALQRLLVDVESGSADFSALLVYDVSRLGRFQDTDEAAEFELRCKRAGVVIQYCAEQFENDGSMMAGLFKAFKRSMAGEYSRELSVKVHAGQTRLIELGFRQGGAPGFGMRRQLVDENLQAKGNLAAGQHKSIQTDRVILVPGPSDEIAIVRTIYNAFVKHGRSEREIADDLNRRGLRTDLGRSWTRGTVHQILINEKYIGNNVWNRTSFRLKQAHIRNPREKWIRRDGAFEAIVDVELFAQVQAIIAQRSIRLTDAQMLDALKLLLNRHGCLSGIIIDESEDSPSSSAFRSRFGGLLRAYQLVGFSPSQDYGYLEINKELRRLHPQIISDILAGIVKAGGTAVLDPRTDIVRVNDEFALSIVLARYRQTEAGSARWNIKIDHHLKPDITVAVRMDPDNQGPLDYYLLPHLTLGDAFLRLCEHNGLGFDAYRVSSLDSLFALSERSKLRRAA
jgi:DNA invertase Pin-like site-specific DNA recombinase